MSSAGQVVGGFIGATIGFFLGGPLGAVQGFAIGSGIGGALFPPPGPDGPRLQDLTPQSSEYGKPIVFGYGTIPVQGNVIWASDLVEQKHEEGGKGSGGGSTVFTYFGNFAVGLVQAPTEGIGGITRIWAGPDKRLIYDITPGATGIASEGGVIRVFNGADTQMPSALQESYEGVGNVPAYRGLAYVEFEMFPLAKDHNTIPFLLCEVVMKGAHSVSEAVRFGESNSADMDPDTGYIWTNPGEGHAEATFDGPQLISNDPVPQIQWYDPIKCKLMGFRRVPGILVNPDTHRIVYPSAGTLVYSGGWFFVGSGTAGDINGYPVGAAINPETKSFNVFAAGFASDAFNGAFYWPTVPIPAIDNNGIYFAGGNGISGGFALGFMPAGWQEFGKPPYYPHPDRSSGEFDRWVAPIGFEHRRNPDPHTPGVLDITSINMPDWAVKAYVINRPNAVLIQGYGGYVTLSQSAQETGTTISLSPAGVNNLGELHIQSNTDMPPIVFDRTNMCGWAFCGETGHYSLFKITETTLEDQEFALPGDRYVIGGDFDKASGYLRLLTMVPSDTARHVILFDPIGQEIVDEIEVNVDNGLYGAIPGATGYGRVWNNERYRCLIYNQGSHLWKIPYGQSLAGEDTLLSEVVTDLHLRAGLTEDQIDASALTDVVDGYQIARQTSVRSAIDALRPVYFFDSVESGALVKYVKRGGASVATIADEDLGARLASEAPVDPLATVRQMENELPAGVNVTYQLKANDYDTATKFQKRLIGASGEQVAMQLPMVLSDQKAQEVADVNTFGPWIARLTYQFQLPRKYAYLEPTDPIMVKGFGMRLTKITDTPHGVRKCEAVAEDGLVYSPNSITTTTLATVQVIAAPVRSNLDLLDINLVRDTDDSAGFYAAASGADTPWPSVTLFRSADGGATYTKSETITDAATMGRATNALGDFQNNIFDELNGVNISLDNGALSSATELAVLNGANVAVLGDEILQFKTATLETDGTYTLTGLLRGRRGTEWAAARHRIGDAFVVLTPSTTTRVPGATAEIGLLRSWKGVTAGATLAATPSQGFTNTGAGLKPYAPVLMGGGRNAGGDMIINWTRRSRTGGEWRDYVDVPLGELSEAYQVDIVSPSNVVLRTFDSTVQSVTYPAADQVADFGSAGGLYNVATITNGIAHAAGTSSGDPMNLFDPEGVLGWIYHGDCWMSYQFNNFPLIVEAYRLTEFPDNSYTGLTGLHGPIEWTMDVSDDGDTWTTVDTVTGEADWLEGDSRTYTLAAPVRAQYWRLSITGIQDGGPHVMLRRFELLSHLVAVAVYQMSPIVGRGYAALALLPGGAPVLGPGPVSAPSVITVTPAPEPTATLFVATTGSDSNAGTSIGAPFLTIAHASAVAVPGDVISVADGDYPGSFQTTKDGTAGAPITFIAATRWGAKIVPPTTSARNFGWDSRGDYVTIDGFEVDGSVDPTSGTRWTVGLGVAGEGSIIQNCHAHHIYNNGTANSTGGAGILLDSYYGGQNMRALSNRVHHVGPATGGTNWYHGIYMTASGEIKNNLSYANVGGGVHCWHDVRHLDIANNTLFANGFGVIYGGGDYVNLSSPCDYVTITNNLVYSNGIGIRELGDIGSHNLVRNNLCVSNGTNYSLSTTAHTNDVTGAPLFVNYQADGSGDYKLQVGSPAINAGLATYAPAVDYDGAARPSGPAVDLGAYERT